jgi:hypothetical protein
MESEVLQELMAQVSLQFEHQTQQFLQQIHQVQQLLMQQASNDITARLENDVIKELFIATVDASDDRTEIEIERKAEKETKLQSVKIKIEELEKEHVLEELELRYDYYELFKEEDEIISVSKTYGITSEDEKRLVELMEEKKKIRNRLRDSNDYYHRSKKTLESLQRRVESDISHMNNQSLAPAVGNSQQVTFSQSLAQNVENSQQMTFSQISTPAIENNQQMTFLQSLTQSVENSPQMTFSHEVMRHWNKFDEAEYNLGSVASINSRGGTSNLNDCKKQTFNDSGKGYIEGEVNKGNNEHASSIESDTLDEQSENMIDVTNVQDEPLQENIMNYGNGKLCKGEKVCDCVTYFIT